MSFTQEAIPAVISRQTLERYGADAPFRHWSVIRQWVEDIFTRGGHDELVEFSTTVEKAEKQGQQWNLTFRKEAPGSLVNEWRVEKFDAVVVASGHYNLPYIPDIIGLPEYEDRYPGSIRHCKHYRSADEFRGKVSKTHFQIRFTSPSLLNLHDIECCRSRRVRLCIRCPTRD